MRSKIESYISMWENRCYKAGIPDEADRVLESLNKVPSYRSVAIAILSNDSTLKSLGFTGKKSKYYSDLKRIELIKRGVIIQLKLPL